MPNKDSFTFSDKLRKSKSVPLSKRLPSIVGGKNTQKRTLVQRAQRDLPFILVAALALLLLPFLSRTGSDDIASTGDFAWNSLADAPSFAEGGGADVMPAGSLKDPLDWIVRPRSQVEGSGVTMGTDASKSAYGSSSEDGYGDGSNRSSGYRSRSYSSTGGTSSTRPDYNTRKSYDEQYTTKTTKVPATTKYGAKTRPSVRKSFERKATDINRALRLSQMPGHKGGSGITHTLPIGQGPTRGSGTAFREGIRPIALQPMEARGGVGRSMTGENLYAEAARSRNAMNAGGPAKANLLAAQMRDVDGKLTPEGPGFGGPGPGASVRPGGHGGGPTNKNGYNVDKPWWWDMMNARSQKMWDLLYYKPREMFWTNMYKIGLGLFNCLFTGNKDGDVSNFFGKGGSTDDYICVDPITHKKIEGTIKASKHAKKFSNTTESGSKDSSKTATDAGGAFDSWSRDCEKKGGIPWASGSDDKNFFQVRAECLGLDVLFDGIKSRIKHTKYDSHCMDVNSDPMKFSLNVTRDNARGKHNTRREETLKEKTVITLLAKVKEGSYKGQELVVYAQQGNTLSSDGATFAKDFNKDHKNCALSRLVAFTSRKGSIKVEQRISRYNSTDTARQTDVDLFEGTEDGLMIPSFSVIPEQGQVNAAKKICTGPNVTSEAKPLTLNDIRSMAELGKGKKLNDNGDRYAECEIWEKKPIFTEKKLNGIKCEDCCERGVEIKERVTFTADIKNSKDKQVHAVLVEEIDGESKAKVIYVANFNADSMKGSRNCPEGSDTCTYTLTLNVASLGFNPNKIGTEVRTEYPSNTSSRSSTDYTQANTNTREDTREVRADQMAKYQDCQQRRAAEIAACDAKLPPAGTAPTDTQLAAYNTCMSKVQTCNDSTAQGNFPGNSESSSDGSNPNTARGAGRIFWIVTKPGATLKVDMWQEIAKTLNDINIRDLIESNQTIMYDMCRYRWCNDAASCDLPRDPTMVCKASDGNFYLYEEIDIEGHTYNLKLDLMPDYKGIGTEPLCHEFCKDEEGINCPHRKIKRSEKEIMELFPSGSIDKMPSCTPYCQYKGKMYDATLIDRKYYIINAEVRGENVSGLPKCYPLAWAWEGSDFRIYDFVDEYDDTQLPLTPNQLMDATSATHNSYTTRLQYLEQSDLFITIRGQAIDSGKPREFKLFPRLVLPDQIEIDLVKACNFCGESLYDNADVRADEEKTIKPVSNKIRDCFTQVRELEQILGSDDPDIQKLKTVYFYGYASKRGSHRANLIKDAPRVGCTTSGAKTGDTDDDNPLWGNCNKSLSEDRSLYIMDRVIGYLKPEFGIDVDKYNDFSALNGFSNTLPSNPSIINKTTKRLIKQPVPSGDEFTFVSYPCGSDGAAARYDESLETQQPDRLVLITPINEGQNYCESRMTCEVADKKMREIENSIKKKLSKKKIEVYEPTSNKNQQPTAFVSATQSDEDYIAGEKEDLNLLSGSAYEAASAIQALHSCREDIQSGKYRYPQICNGWIEDANELLGLNKNEGIVPNGDLNLTITRQKQLLERYDSVGVKEVLKKLNFEYAII